MSAPDPDHIRSWQRIDARTTTSGRIEAGDVPQLAAIGVRHVINLALDDHPDALADEGAKLAAHGIGYTHIPVPFDAPGEDHFAAFRAALAAAPGPAHVHCIMNWRVSAFFYRLHVADDTMTEAAARALMEQQWSPDTSADPRAAPWAAFISRGNPHD
ncbi:beta-lactamase hydrolase domain-containing protein [Novosphingobium lentum]|uniref:beta-lactamase hydrolase domain-containing protein n=1 Tax=Novosphingobium lentum TaxID=145287 RepID=UPI00082CF1B6|nr:sulfur transferase domain-containing protein [Novosphingobium lentum]